MIEGYYAALSTVFGPVLALPPILAELVLAAIITAIITLCYRYMVNQNDVRTIKAQVKELQAKIKELQKTNPEAANQHMSEMLKLNNAQMRLQFKPMLPTMLFVLAIFPWMATVFGGFVPALPFQSDLISALAKIIPPWLLWYILLSLPMNTIFRKLMGVE